MSRQVGHVVGLVKSATYVLRQGESLKWAVSSLLVTRRRGGGGVDRH